MPRVLRNLKIRKISAVDRAANEDAKIMLWKRDPTYARFAKILGVDRRRLQGYGPSDIRRFGKQRPVDEVDDDAAQDAADAAAATDATEGNGGDAPRHAVFQFLDQALADIEETGGKHGVAVDRDRAKHWLRHSAHGRAYCQHLADLAGTLKREPASTTETPMALSTNEQLSVIAKTDGGIAMICKSVVDGSTTLSEFELSKLIGEAAQRAYPALKPASAFAKFFAQDGEAGVTMRRAVQASCAF